jgi:hypothetical protein
MERRRAVLTIGYQHRTVDDVIDELRCAEVEVLVDVRLTPLSPVEGGRCREVSSRAKNPGRPNDA